MTYSPQEQQKFIPRLLMDLKKLHDSNLEGDILIKVGKEPDEVREYYAHSFLMSARSPYFNAALSNRWNTTTIDNDENEKATKIVLNEPDIKPKIFNTIYSYIYIGKIDLTNYDGFMLIELLEAADRLLIDDELVLHVQKYLRKTKADWIQENHSKFLSKIFLYDDRETFESLRTYCIEILLQNPHGFFDSKEFLTSDENFLYQLLRIDDLHMEDIEIWNYLIKWGKNRFKKLHIENNDNYVEINDDNNGTSDNNNNNVIIVSNNNDHNINVNDNNVNDNDNNVNDNDNNVDGDFNNDNGSNNINKVEEWTDDDFDYFENILHNLIPLIDFFKISSQDFYLHVYPYHKILPGALLDDLLGSYLLPNYIPKQKNLLFRRKSPIDSKIITYKHSIMIEQWIEKEDNVMNNYWDNNNSNTLSSSSSLSSPTSTTTTTTTTTRTTTNNNNNRYEWLLLFQGSRDGFSGKVFHEKCNDKGSTVVVVKIRGTEELIGGYKPTGWCSKIYKTFEKDSFIFSLGSSHKIDKAIVSRLLPESVDTRLFQKSSDGPVFGDRDLYISDECNSNYSSEHKRENYTRRIREPGTFLVEDYEVFKVNKKM